ncbi:T9SS type A sorting domain-containing protein [Bernardetia sp. MNP-M8]|uniref:T9SS type A sorting domain-containing protein n=1 Tax=Bernardetia sp. MNP-M8 TaxID=3127470 RepID=UPI0030CF57F8
MYKNIFFFLFVYLFFFSNYLSAQQTARRTDNDKGNIGYLEHLPSDYATNSSKTYPVLIFLHGQGEKGSGSPSHLERVKENGPPKHIKEGHPMCFTVNGKQECFIVISPQLFSDENAWRPSIVQDVIDHVVSGSDNYRIDRNRIYLTGLSLGGIGVYKYAADGYRNNENILAAIAPVAARTATNKVEERGCSISEKEIPVWHFHGNKDKTVIYDAGLKTFNGIKDCNNPKPTAELIFTTYEGVGHNSWSRAYKTDNSLHSPNLYEWLLSKSLNNSSTPAEPQKVIWTDKVGVSEDANGNIRSTTAYGWGNSGAASTQVIPENSNGWAETTILEDLSSNSKIFGLSSSNANADKDQIQYAFEIYGDNIAAFENGQRVKYLGKYILGDVIRIERVGTDIQYLINGVLKRVTTGSNSSLLIDIAINNSNTGFFENKIFIGSAASDRIESNNNSVEQLALAEVETSIFPNPAIHQITIQDIPNNTQAIQIYNFLGRLVLQENDIKNKATIDISNLETGLYSIYFVGTNKRQRFIKTK